MKTLTSLARRLLTRPTLGAACFLFSHAVIAAPAAAVAASPAASSPPATPLIAAASQADASEPVVREVIVEDEAMRIEELRVRGVLKRVTVQPKGAVKLPGYEILLPQGKQDHSDGAGRSVWRVMSF